MAKFKVSVQFVKDSVQFVKDFEVEAETAEEARQKAIEEGKRLNFSYKIFGSYPKNLDEVKPKKEAKK